MTDAEELDEEATATQLDRLAGRIDGIMLLGITGELALLPASVADRLTEVVLDRADPGLTVMLGIGDAGTRRALHHLRRAAGRPSTSSRSGSPAPGRTSSGSWRGRGVNHRRPG
ncbi:hypothetical protein ABZ260_43715, partial [Streptosporangium sp. NPDC006013]|uniref:hypothetical protein n=1 Tax=Streptosporangium sp. NPDC006013 TaxID=3155596 RepID=UPI0033B8BDE9